jgi:hypothetical protein
MSARTALVVAAAVAASLGVAGETQRPGASPDLRGVWKLASYVRDGKPVPMDAVMIITPGHFSRVESERDRNALDGIDFRHTDKLTPEQLRIVAEAYSKTNASAGTYRTDAGMFYFTSMVHHNPQAAGHEAKRKLSLNGDRLILSGPAGSGDLIETWERVETFR